MSFALNSVARSGNTVAPHPSRTYTLNFPNQSHRVLKHTNLKLFIDVSLHDPHTHAQTRFFPVVTHALTYAVIILFPLISSSFSPLPLKSSKTLLSVWEEHKQQIRHAAILDTHTSHMHAYIFIFSVFVRVTRLASQTTQIGNS